MKLLWTLAYLLLTSGSGDGSSKLPHTLVFTNYGQLHDTLGFVTLQVHVPLSIVTRSCIAFQNIKRNTTSPQEAALLQECQDLPVFQTSTGAREKRSVITTIAATVFGWFGLQELLGMGSQARMDDLNKTMDTLKEDIKLQDIHNRLTTKALQREVQTRRGDSMRLWEGIQVVKQELQHLRDMRDLKNVIDNIKEGMRDLSDHRLSPKFLSNAELRRTWSRMEAAAKARGGTLALHHPEQVYQAPASAILEAEDLMVLVHLPVSRTKTGWTLYTYQPHPQVIRETPDGAVLAQINPRKNIIATRGMRTEEHMELGHHDLRECLVIGRTHFCGSSYVHKRFTRTCIGRLFQNQMQDIELHCPTNIKLVQEAVIPEDRGWLIYTRAGLILRKRCSNGTSSNIRIKGTHHLPPTPGCDFETDGFRLSGSPFATATDRGHVVNVVPRRDSEPLLRSLTSDLKPSTDGRLEEDLAMLKRVQETKEANEERLHDHGRRHLTISGIIGATLIGLILSLIIITGISIKKGRDVSRV